MIFYTLKKLAITAQFYRRLFEELFFKMAYFCMIYAILLLPSGARVMRFSHCQECKALHGFTEIAMRCPHEQVIVIFHQAIRMPVKKQYTVLGRKMQGHYAYYGITGNGSALQRFWHETRPSWKEWLSRRSQRGLSWERFLLLEKRYRLPSPRVVHSVYARVANP